MSPAALPSLNKVMQRCAGVYRLVSGSGVIRLILLFGASLELTLWLATGQVNADFLFQSPESPAPPPFIESGQAQPPVEQPPAQPASEQQPPTVEQPPPVEQPPVVDPNAPQPPIEPSPPAAVAPTPPPPEPARRNREEPPEAEADAGPSNFILDQAELIDTVVVTSAWVWLCCGILLLLIVPLFFVVVYIRGRRKIIDQEDYR
ncbi:MAG: hypothetical protein U0401_23010 [Anaerolineae bacterium]